MSDLPDIDLEDIKDYLRIDHDGDDVNLALIAESAESYIRSLCRPFEVGALPPEIRQAVFVLASHWYDNRGIVGADKHREIPYTVSALIANHRDWDGDNE